MPMNNYTLHISYGEDIRSIDLENILAGIRLIGEHEISKQTGKHVRNFTNSFRIKSIEKGSIVINLTINVDIDLIFGIASVLEIYSNRGEMVTIIKTAINGIKAALNHGNRIHIQKNSVQVDAPADFDGEILIDKDDNLRLKSNSNNPNIK